MSQPGGALLRLEGLTKSFGGHAVLKGIDLAVSRAEFLTLLGPSGCGKTTTLRIIAGFDKPDAGKVLLGGRDVVALPPYQRDVHTVFQHYALFPHYDVFENVAFALRVRGRPQAEIELQVRDALALVKLTGFERRRTASLSGGQMQRVALARALVGMPALLLLDEPLGALDLKLRKAMQLELKSLQRRTGIAFVYVTHDQEEAMTISDRIAVFNHGRIEQVGPPEEIYERPRTSFVADFLGAANVLSARVVALSAGGATLRLEDEVDVLVPHGATPLETGAELQVAIRPERLAVRASDAPAAAGVVRLKATVVECVFVGSASQIFLQPFSKSDKTVMSISMDNRYRRRRDENAAAWIDLHPDDIRILSS